MKCTCGYSASFGYEEDRRGRESGFRVGVANVPAIPWTLTAGRNPA